MKRTYHFQVIRQPSARGLNHLAGTVEAHSVKDARRQVEEIVADNARVGLMKGEFLLTMQTDALVLKDRVLQVACAFADEAVPMYEGPTGKTLLELLDERSYEDASTRQI